MAEKEVYGNSEKNKTESSALIGINKLPLNQRFLILSLLLFQKDYQFLMRNSH